MANPFYVEPAQFGQGLSALAGSVQQFGQQRQAQQQAEAQKTYEQQAKQAVATALQSGDPRMMQQVSVQFPEVAESMRQAYGFTNDLTEQAAKAGYRQFLGSQDPTERLAILEGTVDTIAELGGRPIISQEDVERFKRDPEGTAKSIEMAYAGIDPEGYEALTGGASGPSIGTYNPRDYTTESFAEFTRTNDPSVLERYAAQRTVDIGGVPHVFDPARGGYYPASVSGRGAGGEREQRPVTATDVAASEAEITGAKETAKQDVKSKSPEEQRKIDAEIKERRKELAKAQDVLTRLQSIENNPGFVESITGVRGKLPAIPGTEGFDAEIAFDQLKDTLTLGNLGQMSGVLSESDIKILSSAASGLEYGMSEEALQQRLKEIRSVFESKTQAEREKISDLMGRQPSQDAAGMSDADADAFINSMLGQ